MHFSTARQRTTRSHPWLVRMVFLLFPFALAAMIGPYRAERFHAHDAAIPSTSIDARPTGVEESAAPVSAVVPRPSPPRPQRDEHLALLGVPRWHAAGLLGRGVKVAVLDSGFRGYRDYLGASLPARVTVKSFRFDGDLEARDSQHGILCAEVIHAVAPDAELLFANWEPDSSSQFLEAVRWARSEGAHIVSCSLIMPSWSDGEGHGTVADGLARILGPGRNQDDMLFFASAGNTAQRHWSGHFHAGADGWHEWSSGQPENRLTPWGTETVSVELYGSNRAQFQAHVFDTATGTEVGQPEPSKGTRGPWNVVRFVPRAGAAYSVRVRRTQGSPGRFHIVVLGAGLAEYSVSGSIPFPGDSDRVVAVGAVTPEGRRLAYSSCGPNSNAPKPDFVAPVPFPCSRPDRPFSGTSAAAPQGAGLAALYWCCNPNWTANQIRATLRECARDLGPLGHHNETGYGLLLAPRSLLAGPRRGGSLRLPVTMAP